MKAYKSIHRSETVRYKFKVLKEEEGRLKVSHRQWTLNKIVKDKINQEPEHDIIKGSRAKKHGGPQEDRLSWKEGKIGTSENSAM